MAVIPLLWHFYSLDRAVWNDGLDCAVNAENGLCNIAQFNEIPYIYTQVVTPE